MTITIGTEEIESHGRDVTVELADNMMDSIMIQAESEYVFIVQRRGKLVIQRHNGG